MTALTQKKVPLNATPALNWLEQQEDEMLALLQSLVNIDSGSYYKEGVDAVGDEIKRFLDSFSIQCQTTENDRYGEVIRASAGVEDGRPHVLLMGHRDTVFKQGEVAERPFRIEEGTAYGPGVADMKAGLVINSFVMAALAKFDLLNRPIVALYTGDEEIGSPFSRPFIESAATNARAVFNAEPGRANGNVVTSRRGSVFVKFKVTGKAAHSGANHADGASAVAAMSHKVIALEQLTDYSDGVTANVGLISGGNSVNTVAPWAQAEFDLRYTDPARRDVLLDQVRKIMEEEHVPGTSAAYEVIAEFLPLFITPKSEQLFQHYVSAAALCGLSVEGEFTGGCADSGVAASMGVPVLCATGPVGAKVHSVDEYMDVASLVPRAKALALAIATLDDH